MTEQLNKHSVFKNFKINGTLGKQLNPANILQLDKDNYNNTNNYTV